MAYPEVEAFFKSLRVSAVETRQFPVHHFLNIGVGYVGQAVLTNDSGNEDMNGIVNVAFYGRIIVFGFDNIIGNFIYDIRIDNAKFALGVNGRVERYDVFASVIIFDRMCIQINYLLANINDIEFFGNRSFPTPSFGQVIYFYGFSPSAFDNCITFVAYIYKAEQFTDISPADG